ncbi:DinB family protein [Williamsia sp.]|uniref:DinB family protein n=1 Tax=Williamsia sp. TaxID=1872085 RepID=UPI002F95F8CF
MTSDRPSPRSRRADNPPPRIGSSEKEVLVGFLDYLRESVATKLSGVSEAAARKPAVQSGTNLIGLVRHLTNVEQAMFLGKKVTNWKATFTATDSDTVDSIVDEYRDSIARANAVIATYTDLAEPAPCPPGRTSAPSMRWALTHMIEETGRHAGHLDIIREQIDGRTGR